MSDVSTENVIINEEDNVNEETAESNEIKKEVVSPEDYKLIRDMIKEMDEWNKMLHTESVNILHDNYGLSEKIFITIGMISEEKIKEMTLDEIKDFFKNNADERYINNIPEITDLDQGIKYMNEVKEIQTNIYNATMDSEKMKKDSQSIIDEYLNYLSSNKVSEARQKRIENMKVLAEGETDNFKKRQMEKMIKTVESMDNFDFVFDRFEKFIPEKEIKNTFEQFFDSRRSNYIMDRFTRRIYKFGFQYPIYKYFLNLEENFLDEIYHPFNNLFLFYYTKYVAYADPYDKTQSDFVKVFTSTLANLVYHRFPTNETEKKFIEIIKKFDDLFMDKRDYFIENNTTHPNHPVRLQASMKEENDRKNSLITKMDELGITGYDTNQSANDLQKYMNDELDRIISENTERKESKSSDSDENTSELMNENDIQSESININKNIFDKFNFNTEESGINE